MSTSNDLTTNSGKPELERGRRRDMTSGLSGPLSRRVATTPWAVALLGATLVLFSLQEPAHASQPAQASAEGRPAVTVDAQDVEAGGDFDGVPKWVWATLVMVGFVALSVVTMVLARGPVRWAPPPVKRTAPSGEHAQAGESEGG